MPALVHDERVLTDVDYGRLLKLGRALPPELADVLEIAEVASPRTVDADVVTMYSRVVLVDQATHRRHTLTICYPRDAAAGAGLVSVLSPVGMGVLGLRVGDIARWRTPLGADCEAKVEDVQYQPEATGDYST